MLYTDGVHLISTSLTQLCAYASTIGLNHEWLQLGAKTIHPHLKICGNVRRGVLEDKRVKQVTSKEIIRICKMNYVQPETKAEVKEWENYHGKKLEEVYKPAEKDYERMFRNIFEKCGIKNLQISKSEQLLQI
jgi:hypothetical protein